ncbi:MAG: acyl transferase [Bacteroidetes bacterium]|nr:acyl transferase [Bacteroidota bacterium]
MTDFDFKDFQKNLFSDSPPFEDLKNQLWEYQLATNHVIQKFCKNLPGKDPYSIPISFFKHFELKSGDPWKEEMIFESSGTTGQTPSQHFIRDLSLYEKNCLKGFYHFFPKQNYRILALLPSYLERGNSSLVYMVQTWINNFGLPGSGFFLDNVDELYTSLKKGAAKGEPMILIGVSFALLDLAENETIKLPPETIVIETGGMKGRRRELIRKELHQILKTGLGVNQISSEYGMTELLSQAYTVDSGRFKPSPTMQVFVSDIHLDRLIEKPGVTGRLHVIDLANIHSCAFIATDDIGRMHEDGSFEVLGRLDHAEMRGCNLMYE